MIPTTNRRRSGRWLFVALQLSLGIRNGSVHMPQAGRALSVLRQLDNREDAITRFARFVLAALFFLFATSANSAEKQVLRGHVPVVVSKLKSVERLASSKHLNLSIALPLRDREALTNLLQEICDPMSPNYHQYLTPQQFAERFGPTEVDYQAVMDFAKAKKLTITDTTPNRTLLGVSGSVQDIENAFHVTLRIYSHPTEPRKFYSPDNDPSVDLAVLVLEVTGLDDYFVPRPEWHHAGPRSQKHEAKPDAGSGPFGSYMGNDFRAAYVPGVMLIGTGQKVGLFELDGYYTNDPSQYAIMAGLTNSAALASLTNVLVDGFDGTPGANNVEAALDIEMVMSMSPGARIIVYEGPNAGAGAVHTLNRMATDNLANQLSSSWSIPTGPTTVQIFQQMVGQGQAFFNSSGDHGAYSGVITGPKDVPYITVVGGTTLTTTGPGGDWETETVWNWNNGIASGGGISTSYALPNWQLGIDMSSNHGSTTMRNIPDVAMVADNIYVIADNGVTHFLGGTSVAAPLWAGFCALVNERATLQGKQSVGFLNPTLYAICKGTNYAMTFHDISNGNNTNSSSPTNFFALSGYDLCTGWGSPRSNLIDALLNVQLVPAIGWTLTSLPSQSWSCVAASADGTTLIAADSSGAHQINVSSTSGLTWRSYGPSGDWRGVACSANGTKMAAAPWEGPINISTNSGITWSVSTSPSYSWRSMASSADGSKLAAGADWEGLVDVSTNSGETWRAATGAPGGGWMRVAWSADGNVLITAAGSQVYVTTNWGVTGTYTNISGNDFSGVAASSDGSTLIAAGNPSIWISRDLGKSWSNLSVPSLYWSSAASSEDGYRLVACANGNGIYISDDGGVTWSNTGPRNAAWSAVACSAYGSKMIAAADNYFDGPVYIGFFPRGGPVIQEGPTNQAVVVNSNAVLSVAVVGPPPLSYQWSFNGTNIVGASEAVLILTNVQYSQSGSYAVTVGNGYGLSISSGIVLTVLPPSPTILFQPADRTTTAGSTASFAVTVEGAQPLIYQWRFNGTNIAGATTTLLMLPNVQPTNSGKYSVVVTNELGSATSSNAALTVVSLTPCIEPPFGLASWWQAEGNATDSEGPNHGSLVGNITYGPGMVGRGFVLDGDGDAIALGNPVNLQLQELTIEMWIKRGSATLSSQSGGKAYLFAYGTGGYGFALSDGGGLFFEQFSGVSGGAGSVTDTNWHHVALTVDRYNNGIYVDGTLRGGSSWPHSYSFSAAAIGARWDSANSFYGMIDEPAVYSRVLSTEEIRAIYNAGTNGKCGLPDPPFILAQPTNQTLVAGGTASFSVTIGGRLKSLNYQWWFNGTNMVGRTNASLLLTNVQPAHAGSYWVAITNAFGSVTSSNATLTVLPAQPPVITAQPASQAASGGSIVTFTVASTSPVAVTHRWRRNGVNLLNDGRIVGATNDSLTIVGAWPSDSGQYTVVISNAFGSVTSSNATLIVQVTNPPVFNSITVLSNGALRGSLIGYAGLTYIEASTNLVNWDTVTSIILTNSAVTFTDWFAPNFLQRFYRARVE